MPKASIVIPCYNAEKYLRETLESALAQTLTDIELICVDNGSTDGTRAILEEYAEHDERIRIIQELEPGEGPARDAGLDAATGEWLYFLDSDDLMDKGLLEQAVDRGESSGAEIVIFRTRSLNDQTGEVMEMGYSFQTDWLPSGPASVFDPHDYPERILNSFQNWVHNKLFRASFVHEAQLHMQHVHRTADLFFTCRALTEAHRIALLDCTLHSYRIMNPNSAMATSDSFPLDFYDALLALRSRLEECETWELYHDSYVNWAIENVITNLEGARSFEGFRTIASTMQADGFDRLDITGFPAERCDNEWRYARMRDIASLPLDQLIFSHYADLKIRHDATEVHASNQRQRVAQLQRRVAELESCTTELEAELESRTEELGLRTEELESRTEELESTLNSTSLRVGLAVTAPMRKMFRRG